MLLERCSSIRFVLWNGISIARKLSTKKHWWSMLNEVNESAALYDEFSEGLDEPDLRQLQNIKEQTFSDMRRKKCAAEWHRARRLARRQIRHAEQQQQSQNLPAAGTEHNCSRPLNVLTVAQKWQLRQLHDSHPHNWPVDKLAVSFGISPLYVKRLLKSKSLPTDAELIEKHDQQVAANRKKLGLPSISLSSSLGSRDMVTSSGADQSASALLASRRDGHFTSLLNATATNADSAHQPASTNQNAACSQPLSSVYTRRASMVLHPGDSDSNYDAEKDSDMRLTGASVDLPRRPMTLRQVKRFEESNNRKLDIAREKSLAEKIPV